MTHTYSVKGMTCNGCRSTVEKTLNQIEGLCAEVTLNPPVAIITMKQHIPADKLQMALSKVGNYVIEDAHASKMMAHTEIKDAETAKYISKWHGEILLSDALRRGKNVG